MWEVMTGDSEGIMKVLGGSCDFEGIWEVMRFWRDSEYIWEVPAILMECGRSCDFEGILKVFGRFLRFWKDVKVIWLWRDSEGILEVHAILKGCGRSFDSEGILEFPVILNGFYKLQCFFMMTSSPLWYPKHIQKLFATIFNVCRQLNSINWSQFQLGCYYTILRSVDRSNWCELGRSRARAAESEREL